MLWNEFVEGTGCKGTEKNYQVYKDLEVMYMNSDLSKAQIYEYGKKLVDNSKTERELEIDGEVKAEIACLKDQLESDKRWLDHYKQMEDKFSVQYYRQQIREKKAKIKDLKWVLA